jgi:hypothetical protein
VYHLIKAKGDTYMNFNVHQQPEDFATSAEPYLLKHEDIYSLFYGVLQGIKMEDTRIFYGVYCGR